MVGPMRNATLVVGPAWVGDMVMAQSLFKALKADAPEAPIDVIAPPWSAPLLERMPEVRRIVSLAVDHGEVGLRKRWDLGRSLRGSDHARAIVLPRSAKAALPAWIAGIPKRTGYLGEYRYGLLNDIRPLDRTRLYRIVDRFVALATADSTPPAGTPPAAVPRPALTSTREQQRDARSAALPLASPPTDAREAQAPILALCPGAEYGPAKRWPAAHFAALARLYTAQGWAVWLFGSKKDQPITQAIAEQAAGVIDLAGRTTLSQAIDLLAASSVVVSNDTGLMHVAAATGRPLVALYGSSDPQYTPPLSDTAQVLYRGIECSPCFERECPLGHFDCLQGMMPATVAESINQLAQDA